jgi:two-component system, NarL family, response regulator NreC
MKKTIRILLADDHRVLRAGLKLLLERQTGFDVVAEAADGRQAVELVKSHSPDIVLLDIAMPGSNGIEAARQINSHHPAVGIIILSMHADESYLLRALKSGAKGYLLKDAGEEDVIQAVRAVSDGKAFFSPAISKLLVEDYVRQLQQQGHEDVYDLLTAREREITQLLAEGMTSKDVAAILFLSPHTVDTHRKTIFQKLNLHSVPELMLYAMRKGIIS